MHHECFTSQTSSDLYFLDKNIGLLVHRAATAQRTPEHMPEGVGNGLEKETIEAFPPSEKCPNRVGLFGHREKGFRWRIAVNRNPR